MIETERPPEATTSAAPAEATLREIAIAEIHDPGDNVRGKLGDVEELAASVGVHGVIQAVVVRPSLSGGYELTAGFGVGDPLEQGDLCS